MKNKQEEFFGENPTILNMIDVLPLKYRAYVFPRVLKLIEKSVTSPKSLVGLLRLLGEIHSRYEWKTPFVGINTSGHFNAYWNDEKHINTIDVLVTDDINVFYRTSKGKNGVYLSTYSDFITMDEFLNLHDWKYYRW